MKNHDEKRRDMARSILPSKHRRSARLDLAHVKRANRKTIRQELRALTSSSRAANLDFDEIVERWDERTDLAHYPDAEIRSVVRVRRYGDKVEHFIRWAIATTADLPIDDRLSHLRSVLPDGLIGDHAMTHLRHEPELRRSHESEWSRWRWRHREEQEVAQAELRRDLELVRQVLHDVVVAPGGLKGLNRVMKTCDRHTSYGGCREFGCVKRCLAGRHDVDAFVDDVLAPSRARDPRSAVAERLPARRFRVYLETLRAATTAGALDPVRSQSHRTSSRDRPGVSL